MTPRTAAVLLLLLACLPSQAGVVINEILYHAPDDRDELQFIELHNPSERAIDLEGWKLAGSVKYAFATKAKIDAGGFLVVCKNVAEYKRRYSGAVLGPFEGSLGRGKGKLELLDRQGKMLDGIRYGSRGPWPLAPDGYSSSLERICPTAPGDNVHNWAPSPLESGTPRAGGTPGKKNANYSAHLPPVIANVTFTPASAAPDEPIKVEADVRGEQVDKVELRYRVAKSGSESKEESVVMKKGAKDRYSASIPGQKAGQIVRFRVHAADTKKASRFYPSENDVRPALSVYVHEKFTTGKIPFGLVINVGKAGGSVFGLSFGGPPATPPARGKSAFVYVHPRSNKVELFDFINVTPRNGGRKVRFHKDHPLDGMTTINLIFEYMDRFVLAEPLAYEVYRKAGNAACRTDHVRTWVDGQPIGYQLLVEQPNKSFLRHNKLRTDGDMYKLIWQGWGLVGQHEKKTNAHAGHGELIKLVDQLNKTKGDEQWAVIKKNFDVEQVLNYFAVNMILSHWDGFFNNFFTYHDSKGSGKWTMYPWDQDKTWGFHDGIRGYDVFFDMPVTFGMAGDKPPGWPKGKAPPANFWESGSIWWRQGGAFSKPLLANAKFRKLYLARTKELLEEVYTEKVFFPLIKDMAERLEDEVKVRAKLHGEDERVALERFSKNLDSLREHLKKRRKFLLEQDEIKNAGKFDRSELK